MRKIVKGAEFALSATFIVGALTAGGDMTVIAVCLFVAWVFATLAVVTLEDFDANVARLDIRVLTPLRVKGATALALLLVFFGLRMVLRLHYQGVALPTLTTQIDQLNQLDKLFAGQGEVDLWNFSIFSR